MALASVALLSPSRAQGADGGSGIGPEALRSGFEGTPLAADDDNSTGLVPIGFTINFFGTDYTDLFVNNNGNVTFDDPLETFTPFPLLTTTSVIIAPSSGTRIPVPSAAP